MCKSRKRIERCYAQVHRGINLKVCGMCVRLNDGGCEGREVKEEDAVCVCACIKTEDFLVRVAGLGISLGSD